MSKTGEKETERFQLKLADILVGPWPLSNNPDVAKLQLKLQQRQRKMVIGQYENLKELLAESEDTVDIRIQIKTLRNSKWATYKGKIDATTSRQFQESDQA